MTPYEDSLGRYGKVSVTCSFVCAHVSHLRPSRLPWRPKSDAHIVANWHPLRVQSTACCVQNASGERFTVSVVPRHNSRKNAARSEGGPVAAERWQLIFRCVCLRREGFQCVERAGGAAGVFVSGREIS